MTGRQPSPDPWGAPLLGVGSMMATVATLLVLTSMVSGVAAAPPEPAAPGYAVQGPVGDPPAVWLVDQSAFVEADGTFVARIDLGSVPGLIGTDPRSQEIVVTVFSRLSEPDDLGSKPTQAINRRAQPVGELPVDGEGLVILQMPIRSGPAFDDLDRIRIPDPGVYPLSIEVRADGQTRATVRTTLIRMAEDDGNDPRTVPEPIRVAVVVAITGSPGTTIEEAIQLLSAHPSVSMTVVLGPTELERLRNDTALSEAFRTALDGRPVATAPRPDLDPSSMASIDQIDLYRRAVDAGRGALTELGIGVDPLTVPVDGPPTDAGATALAGLAVETAIDLRSFTGGPRGDPGRLPADDGRVWLVATDPLASELTRPAAPSHRVQQLLARLVLRGPSRPKVIGLARPTTDGVSTLSRLLDTRTTGRVEIVPLAEAEPPVGRDWAAPATAPREDLAPIAADLDTAEGLLASYELVHLDGPAPPDEFRDGLIAALGPAVDPADRGPIIDDISDRLSQELSLISLPENQSVTLAARSAQIPLKIQNDASGSRRVLLEFRSDKIVVRQDGAIMDVEPGVNSIDIEVESRSLGASPLQVSLLSPDRRHVLFTTRFQVRSTAVPGLGLLVSGTGLVLLAVWWYLSIRRRRSPHPSRSGLTPPDERPDGGGHDRDGALAADSV